MWLLMVFVEEPTMLLSCWSLSSARMRRANPTSWALAVGTPYMYSVFRDCAMWLRPRQHSREICTVRIQFVVRLGNSAATRQRSWLAVAQHLADPRPQGEDSQFWLLDARC